MSERPRILVDPAWANQLEAFLRKQVGDGPAPDVVEGQVEAFFRAGYFRHLGLLRYALGAPLEEVRRHFRMSSEFSLAVYRFRDLARGEPADAPTVDASLTNSRDGLAALELALACGARDLATTLAPLIGDPPGARFPSPGSEVCTPDDQAVAYALRDFLLNRPTAPNALDPSSFAPKRAASLEALRALREDEGGAFLSALEKLHGEHLDALAFPRQVPDIESLIDIPTLALVALAGGRFPELFRLADSRLPLGLFGSAE